MKLDTDGKIGLLNMEPYSDMRNCQRCGRYQDAIACKQHALCGGLRWKCGFCSYLNNWKIYQHKSCQVKGK